MCGCSCHSACRVPARGAERMVPVTAWFQLCTCPGAEPARQSMAEAGVDLPESGGFWQEARRQSRLRQEAMRAAQVQATGRSREEIRDIYVAELRARGLRVPGEAGLDAAVDAITGSTLHAVRVTGRSLAELAKALYRMSRLFSERR